MPRTVVASAGLCRAAAQAGGATRAGPSSPLSSCAAAASRAAISSRPGTGSSASAPSMAAAIRSKTLAEIAWTSSSLLLKYRETAPAGSPRLAEHALHRRLVEPLAREAARGGVQDLLSPPLQVLVADPRHGNNIKRMSALDKPRDSRRHYKERSSDLRRWCR